MPNRTVTISVYWDGKEGGAPDAKKARAPGKRQDQVDIVWVPGEGIASIDGFELQSNPGHSLTQPTARADGSWIATDTLQGNDTIKYIVQATARHGYGQQWSPDPEIQNEIEP